LVLRCTQSPDYASIVFDAFPVFQYKDLSRQKARIDYFATSLPTLLLFNDDLQKRQKLTASVLQAQADLLSGQAARSASAFRRILKADPSHEIAFDMLEEFPVHTGER
jgi:hypothetical protein